MIAKYYLKSSEIWHESQRGFSLIELLVVMAIFLIALAISSALFVNTIGQAKQQSKLAESQMEGVAGLEMLRADLERAGYGLPWTFPATPPLANYQEAAVPGNGSPANAFNAINSATNGVPKALDGNTVGPNVAGSSYLVVRAVDISTNNQSQTWTGLLGGGLITGLTGAGSDQPPDGCGVIVLDTRDDTFRQLIVPNSLGGAFSAQYQNPGFNAAFSPSQPLDGRPSNLFIIYGVDNNFPLRMPFNRADYFISGGAPASCAPGTGTLTKNMISHGNGTFNTIPLIDCVADFQVYYGIDINNDGLVDIYTQDLTVDPISLAQPFDPANMRNEVKEIRVYLLMHEGRKDPSFSFNDFNGGGTNIRVGETGVGNNGRLFNLATIADYRNYRWKVVTLVVTPKNLK